MHGASLCDSATIEGEGEQKENEAPSPELNPSQQNNGGGICGDIGAIAADSVGATCA